MEAGKWTDMERRRCLQDSGRMNTDLIMPGKLAAASLAATAAELCAGMAERPFEEEDRWASRKPADSRTQERADLAPAHAHYVQAV